MLSVFAEFLLSLGWSEGGEVGLCAVSGVCLWVYEPRLVSFAVEEAILSFHCCARNAVPLRSERDDRRKGCRSSANFFLECLLCPARTLYGFVCLLVLARSDVFRWQNVVFKTGTPKTGYWLRTLYEHPWAFTATMLLSVNCIVPDE